MTPKRKLLTDEATPSLKLVFRQSLVYTAGAWAGRFFNLVSAPILTRIFVPGDFGVIDLIATVHAAISLLLGLGLDSGFARHYAASSDPQEREKYFGTLFVVRLAINIAVVVALCLKSEWVAEILFGDRQYALVVFVAMLSQIPMTISQALLLLLRYNMRARAVAVLSVISIATRLGFVLFFALVLNLGVASIYFAALVNSFVFSLASGYFARRYLHVAFSFDLLRKMLSFGLPLVPASMAYYLITFSDRYFINYYVSLHELGLYAIGNKVTALITLLTAGFSTAWAPFLHSTFMKPGANRTFRRIFNLYLTALFLFATVVSFFAVEVITIFATDVYISAYIVVPLLFYSLIVYQVGDYFPIGIGITRKTYHRAWIGGVTLVANLTFNYLLISRYGMIGAAVSTLLSYSLYCGLLITVSERIYPVGFAIERGLFLMIVGGILIAGVYSLQGLELTWQQMLWKAGVSLFVLALPVVLGIVTKDDLAGFYHRARQFARQIVTRSWTRRLDGHTGTKTD